jgi:NIMA (never in mitosis gene a)-related kinase 1/4/5
MKEKLIWKIVLQVIKGLQALHKLKILHRDMKSANIFLYKDGTAKLGDLNVSKVAKMGLLYTQTGTPYYASPEVWQDRPYDLKSDIWSFGCVIYEMCSLVPPFRASDMNGLFKKVLKGIYPQIPTHYSMDLRQLIKVMLQVNPTMRPDTTQLLDMYICQKRIQKYFSPKDGSMSPILQSPRHNTDLLRTIKLEKNVFKLQMPEANYDSSAI